MNFAEACADVLGVVKRPDKTSEIQKAVNAAISYYTVKGSFDEDLMEDIVTISPIEVYGSFSRTVLTRFRRFSYIRPGDRKFLLTKRDAEQLYSPGNNVQPNSYVVMGDTIHYVLRNPADVLNVGWYTYSKTLAGNDNHWMLERVPQMIIDKAAAKIFRDIGDDASSNNAESSSRDFFKVLLGDKAMEV